jgi:hypothetical protein
MRALIAVIAVVLAMSRAVAGDANPKATTWCWSPRSDIRGDCVYTLRQCEEIVRLRRTGVCHRPGVAFQLRRPLALLSQ